MRKENKVSQKHSKCNITEKPLDSYEQREGAVINNTRTGMDYHWGGYAKLFKVQ